MTRKPIYSAKDSERKQQTRKNFLGLIPLLAIFLLLTIALFAFADLPPALWKTKEVTIAEIQKQVGTFSGTYSLRRPWAGSSRSSQETVYMIEDQDGRTYRVDAKQLTAAGGGAEGNIWIALRRGTDCTVVYSPRLGSRQIKGLAQGDTTYLDADAQAQLWYSYSPLYAVVLLALVGSVWAIVHHVRKGLENLRVLEYQAQVRAEQKKKSSNLA